MAARLGEAAQALTADVTEPKTTRRAFEQAAASFGPVDILVNNAGQARSGDFSIRRRTSCGSSMLAVNLTGTYHGIRAALPAMLERGFGRIVNIASTPGLRGYPLRRGVLRGKARRDRPDSRARARGCAAPRHGERRVPRLHGDRTPRRCHRQHPQVTGRSAEAAREALTRTNPQGRLIEPAEVAHAVAWLCLPGSESVTGQSIAVAGGEVM